MITKHDVAKELIRYMNRKISLHQLVEWAENAILKGGFAPDDAKPIMQALGKIGAADVKEFGLLWEDCDNILHSFGYDVQVKAVLAA